MRLSWSEALLASGVVLVATASIIQWRRDREVLRSLSNGERAPVSLASTPRVSVLMPAWNEGAGVEKAIESFLALAYPNKELVVCAGGRDDTYSRSLRYGHETEGGQAPQVIVLEQLPGEGKQGALRKSLDHATGEIIFLTDADCVMDNDSFTRTLEPLVNDGEAVATGLFRLPLDEQRKNPFVLYQWNWNTYTGASSAHYINGLMGTNAALRRCALERAGSFAADVATGTDYHLAEQLTRFGYKIKNVFKSQVRTGYREQFGSYIRQQSRWLRNIVVHGLKFGSHDLVFSSLRTSILGLGMLVFPLTFPVLKRPGVYTWLLGILYGLLSRVRYMRFGEIHNGVPFPRRHYPKLLFYMFIDFVAWSYPLLEYVPPRLRKRW